jgi:TonB family protein
MNTREQFGKYLLLKKLTEDPLGETFRAGLLGGKGMERVVLLRIFNGQGLDGARLWQAIQNRSSVQQGLKSPNIGDGVGMGEIEGIPYVAYDYVSGKNMANLLEQAARKRNFIPAEHALLITERIALALASAAETRFENDRILHGFLIPHLVMISNEGETRLLGFEVGTGLRVFAGNPVIRQHFGRYMSPEALAGAAPDRIDDIYSLGVILYELVTGRPLPPPGPDGFQSVIDQGVVATEGGPIPGPLAELLKQSLVTRDRRIKDIASWHKTLNKYMFEGQYNPTTFNLAFFMHNLFRQEIERESQEIEVEKTLPVPVLKPKEDTRSGMVPLPVAQPQQGGTGVGPVAPGRGESTGAFMPPPAPEKKSSAVPLIAGLAAVVALGVGAYFLLGNKEEPPPPVAAAPAGPSVEELRAQINEMVSQQATQISADYEARLAKLQDQLGQAQRDADERRKREAEQASKPAAAAPSVTTTAPPPVAPAPPPAETKTEPAPPPATTTAPPPEETKPADVAPSEPAVPAPVAAPVAAAPKTTSQVRRGDLVEAGPGVVMPKLVRRSPPRYPDMARRFNKKGAVVQVKVLIDENGKVLRAEVTGGETKFGFDAAALDAVKKSLYEPAKKDGVPVKIWHNLSIEFRDE